MYTVDMCTTLLVNMIMNQNYHRQLFVLEPYVITLVTQACNARIVIIFLTLCSSYICQYLRYLKFDMTLIILYEFMVNEL